MKTLAPNRILQKSLLLILGFLWSLPLIWVIVISLKPDDLLRRAGVEVLLPYPLTLENYLSLFRVSQTPRWLMNSLFVATSTTLLTLLISSAAGYALARIPFRSKKPLFLLLLSGMMIPEQSLLMPLHSIFSFLELHNSYTGLILPKLGAPFGTLLMMQFFAAVPKEIEEAAQLDHAGRWRIFFFIMLPLARPALTTLGIFTFLAAWNDFLWPLVSITDSDMYTITLGLGSLQGNFAQSEGLGFLMATAVFASLPTALVYIYFQRHIISGIAGAPKRHNPGDRL
jgi:multiple sugar transport system permease protein